MVSEILGKFSICPVCTGMNRRTIACPDRWSHLPRVHGDEPMEGTGCTVVGESAPYARDEPWHAQMVITLRKSAPYAQGCISQIANPIISQDDLPRTHGDEPHRTRPD